MKSYYILTILVFIFGCKEINTADLSIKNRFCTAAIHDNEIDMAQITSELKNQSWSGSKTILNESRKISKWRERYLGNKTTHNLVIYSDSIAKYFSEIPHSDKSILAEISDNKIRVIESKDSSSTLSLLYWTLIAEKACLEEKARKISYGDKFVVTIPSYVNKKISQKLDTVLVSLCGQFVYFDRYQLELSDVVCTNKTTQKILKYSRILTSGPVSIIVYIPKDPGSYEVHGNVKILSHEGFASSLIMDQKFIVQ